jgi:uncharacterized protein YqkB
MHTCGKINGCKPMLTKSVLLRKTQLTLRCKLPTEALPMLTKPVLLRKTQLTLTMPASYGSSKEGNFIEITFTNEAIEQMHQQLPAGSAELKLVFDSEGCGCSVNGVPTLWIVDQPGERDLRAEGNPYELLYEPNHEIFFEDKMTVDYSQKSRNYVLKSSGQIYNANMQMIDKREKL